MLAGSKFARLLWFLLLICAFSVVGDHRAEAEGALASWYGPGFQGLPTASGEPFDASGYTAAHKTLPLGTKLLVSHGGRSVLVTVNDRGPYADGRELDLSQAAARDLGLIQSGVAYVEYSYADNPSPSQVAMPPALNPPQAVAQQPEPLQTGVGYAGFDLAGGDSHEASYPNNSESYPAAQDEANSGTYVVQPGDTLSQIATRLGASVDHLARANGIVNPDIIYSGQTLHFQVSEKDRVGVGSPATSEVVNQDPLIGANMASGEGAGLGHASENGNSQVHNQVAIPDSTVAGGGEGPTTITGS